MTTRIRYRSLIVGLLLVMTAVLALPAAAQDDGLQAACEEIWGDWNADEQRCENEVTYTVSFEYPVEFAAYDFVVEPITELITRQRDEILELRPYVEPPLDPTPGYSVDLSYVSTTHGDNIVNLVYTVFYYTGGAHPNSHFETFTFDLDGGERLSFYDVFPEVNNPLDVIAPIVQAKLTEQFGDAADAEWIAQGAGPEVTNYEDFALTDDSVIFYFEPYQVAAYVFGPSEVEVPLADLTGVMVTLE